MARISQGDQLNLAVLQPGWTFQNDGYGLITVKARWAVDHDSAFSSQGIGIGAIFQKVSGEVLRCQTSTQSYDKNGIVYVDQEYVGVSSDAGGTTRPNVSGSSGLTSEHITTHPNFFDTAIAGPPDYAPSTIEGAKNYYAGNNGAHFMDAKGGRFVGFIDPEFPEFYGKTHYLAPSTTFSGHIFTINPSTMANLRASLGKVSASNFFSGVELIPAVIGTNFVAPNGNFQLMLSQVNLESYALNPNGVPYMMKISYEVRFNRDGFTQDVYDFA
jgi:hypothetical protein